MPGESNNSSDDIKIPLISFQGLNQMSYKDLLTGLIYEGETIQAMNNFSFLNYTHLRFCGEDGNFLTKRCGGICLLTDKRLLFLSSQLNNGNYLVGQLKYNPLKECISSFKDTTNNKVIDLKIDKFMRRRIDRACAWLGTMR